MNVAKFNPTYNPKTFFLDTRKQQEKKVDVYQAAGAIAGTAALSTLGGYINYKIGSKKIDETISKIVDKSDLKREMYEGKIEEFITSPKSIEEGVIEGTTNNPYEAFRLWTQKMRKNKMDCSVMFVGDDERKTKRIIDWFVKSTGQNYRELDADDVFDWDVILEQSEKHHKETGQWNLIYVKNMDKLINSKTSDPSDIALMKSVMTDTGKRHFTTLIFQTKDWHDLDVGAMETYRVSDLYIDTNHMTKLNEYKKIVNKYNKHNTLVEEYTAKQMASSVVQKLQKKIAIKNFAVGFAAVAGVIGLGFLVKNLIQKKGAQNENSKQLSNSSVIA